MEIERRDMLKLGALATGAGALGALAQAAPAGAQQKPGGVHIHATMDELPDSAGGGALARIINIDVFGADDDLSGSGWDANPGEDASVPNQTTSASASTPSGGRSRATS